MLERLDEVDWANLSHAYGRAEDVPECLRALLSEDEEQRESALRHLFGNIYHQGTVYEATAYAVPFLLELATSEMVSDRASLLHLLAAIAAGNSYRDVHGDLWDDFDEEPDFDEQLAKELVWVRAARDAVREGIPLCFSFLSSPDLEVVVAAGYVLCQFPEETQPFLPQIRQQWENTSDLLLRATLLRCLGNLGGMDEATVALLESLADDYEQPLLLRFVAAVALAENAPAHCSPIAIDLLIDISELHWSDRKLEEYSKVIPEEESASDSAKRAIGILDELAAKR